MDLGAVAGAGVVLSGELEHRGLGLGHQLLAGRGPPAGSARMRGSYASLGQVLHHFLQLIRVPRGGVGTATDATPPGSPGGVSRLHCDRTPASKIASPPDAASEL